MNIDENLNWKEYIKYTENKISKNLGLLYKARPFFRKECLTSSILLIYTNLHKLCQYSLGAGPAGQTLRKLTANKNMQYVLFLIKTNLLIQGKF